MVTAFFLSKQESRMTNNQFLQLIAHTLEMQGIPPHLQNCLLLNCYLQDEKVSKSISSDQECNFMHCTERICLCTTNWPVKSSQKFAAQWEEVTKQMLSFAKKCMVQLAQDFILLIRQGMQFLILCLAFRFATVIVS